MVVEVLVLLLVLVLVLVVVVVVVVLMVEVVVLMVVVVVEAVEVVVLMVVVGLLLPEGKWAPAASFISSKQSHKSATPSVTRIAPPSPLAKLLENLVPTAWIEPDARCTPPPSATDACHTLIKKWHVYY